LGAQIWQHFGHALVFQESLNILINLPLRLHAG